MNFNEYQEKAQTTRLPSADIAYVMANLPAEVGELFGKFAKEMRDGTEYTQEDYAKEIGDILWCLACLCEDLGITLEEVADLNLAKLLDRQARGVLGGSGDDR